MKIKFYPYEDNVGLNGIIPAPSIKNIPEWFKEIPTFLNEDKKFRIYKHNNQPNFSIKMCVPFLDSLTAGYSVLLPYDIYVEKNNNEFSFIWKAGGEGYVSLHDRRQISPKMIPNEYNHQPYKFNNFWGIQTPKGYSTIFTHPMNRTDLPFLSLSGIVDTDTYHEPVNFPFLIKNDFEGIIEKGTPIAQIIPFKRESWSHEIMGYSEKEIEKTKINFLQTIYRSYKRNYWHRKEYK